MDICKISIFSTVILTAITSCTRSYYSNISASNFLVNDWYKFDSFRYRGPLKNALPNGLGTVEYNNGTKVTGQFVNGVLNDQEAHYYNPQIGIIEGVAVSGQFISGQIRYSNGDVYTGKIKSYRPNGDGILIKSNNDVYEGLFQAGKFLAGVFLEAKSGTTFQGKFKNWKPDGDVVEMNLDGAAFSNIYSDGINRTESVLANRAAAIVKRINDAEIDEIEAMETQLSSQKETQTNIFSENKAKIEQEGGEMYDRCACTLGLKLCLDVISGASNTAYYYSAYHKEFDLPAPDGPIYSRIHYVALPNGSSKAAIKQAFLHEIEFVSECVKWNADRDNYERTNKDKMANLIAAHQQFLQKVEQEINEKKQQKLLAYQRQESEKQSRHEAELSKMKKEMDDKAQQAAQKRRDFCAKYPDCCLSSASIERLKKSKIYSPCATAQ